MRGLPCHDVSLPCASCVCFQLVDGLLKLRLRGAALLMQCNYAITLHLLVCNISKSCAKDSSAACMHCELCGVVYPFAHQPLGRSPAVVAVVCFVLKVELADRSSGGFAEQEVPGIYFSASPPPL
jgi:hypothetical protein